MSQNPVSSGSSPSFPLPLPVPSWEFWSRNDPRSRGLKATVHNGILYSPSYIHVGEGWLPGFLGSRAPASLWCEARITDEGWCIDGNSFRLVGFFLFQFHYQFFFFLMLFVFVHFPLYHYGYFGAEWESLNQRLLVRWGCKLEIPRERQI